MTCNKNQVFNKARREFIKKLGCTFVTLPFLNINKSQIQNKAPVYLAKKKVTLRVLGTHVTLQKQLKELAEKELNINLEYSPGGSAEILHQASTKPETFDLYEQWSNSLNILWQANAITGIEINRLNYWKEINNLTKKGKINPKAKYGAGDNPNKLLYVQKSGDLSSKVSDKISFLPYVHNVDSFGYNSKFVEEGKPYKTESWGWLLDEKWSGKVAIVNAPTIGLFDLALSARAKNLFECNDIGNLTISEIDKLFDIIIEKKQQGHFRGVWNSVPQSIEFMKNKEVVIESMFSPAASTLKGLGIPCIYAAPKEGYRAWHGVMCLSKKTTGYVEEAAYKYMNWWLSGKPGAFIARQGYYISNPERSFEYLSKEEIDYWYLGKKAEKSLSGTDGKLAVKKGELRRGGSYEERLSNIAVWNTVMTNYEYTLKRWSELLEI